MGWNEIFFLSVREMYSTVTLSKVPQTSVIEVCEQHSFSTFALVGTWPSCPPLLVGNVKSYIPWKMAGGALVGNVRRKSNMTNSLLCLLKSLCTEEVAVKTLRLSQAHVNGTIKHPAYKLCWCCGAPWVPGAVSLPSVTSIKDNGIVTLSDQVERTLLYRSLSQHFQILRNDSQKIDKTYFRGLGNTVGLTYLSRTFCNDLHSENSFASPKKRLHSFALPHRTTPQVGCTRSYSRKHRFVSIHIHSFASKGCGIK